MAYFSNGSEGAAYMEDYCDKCVHFETCPILALHFLWNYEAVNGEKEPTDTAKHTKFVALDSFIPRSKDHLSNEQCLMFHEGASLQSPNAAEEQRKLKEWNELYTPKNLSAGRER